MVKNINMSVIFFILICIGYIRAGDLRDCLFQMDCHYLITCTSEQYTANTCSNVTSWRKTVFDLMLEGEQKLTDFVKEFVTKSINKVTKLPPKDYCIQNYED